MDSQTKVLNVKRACHTFPPHWKSMVLTRNGLHKIISATRQSKKRQQTEPYWVGLSVQYLRQDKRPNGMTRGVFADTLCYLIKSTGKRRLTIRACT